MWPYVPVAPQRAAGISFEQSRILFVLCGNHIVVEAGVVKAEWEFEQVVECNAPRRLCWRYWTDIGNWDDPPARFSLEGPFADGSRITTELPGQTLVSVIRDVREGRAATIEVGLPNALFSFHWSFDDLEGDRTRIGQRLVLSGEDAASFLDQAKVMGKNAPEGVKKLIAAMERAHLTEA